MQRLYNRWSSAYDWAQTRPISPLPDKLDQGLLNGATLARAGRSTAFDFHKVSSSQTVHIVFPQMDGSDIVAMSRSLTVRNSLQEDIAKAGGRILVAKGCEVKALLQDACILYMPTDNGEQSALLSLSLAAYRSHFMDTVHVWSRCHNVCHEWSLPLCTCEAHSLHAQCEHVVFVESLELASKPASRSFHDLPERRRGGRPRGSNILQSRRRKQSAATGKKRKRQADSNAKAVRDEIATSSSEDNA